MSTSSLASDVAHVLDTAASRPSSSTRAVPSIMRALGSNSNSSNSNNSNGVFATTRPLHQNPSSSSSFSASSSSVVPNITTSSSNNRPHVSQPLPQQQQQQQQQQQSLFQERERLLESHKNRMEELDRFRQALDARAAEVERAHRALEQDRNRLAFDFEAKVDELATAKDRLEGHVAHLEAKETQLAAAWKRFEVEKAAAISDAETHLNALAGALAASVGINLEAPASSSSGNVIRNATSSTSSFPFFVIPSSSSSSISPTSSVISVPDDAELLALADRVVSEADAAGASIAALLVTGNTGEGSSSGTSSGGPGTESYVGTLSVGNRAPGSPSSTTTTTSQGQQQQQLRPPPSFASPSIPAKVQAVKLRTTLQLLAQRTSALQSAVDAVRKREQALDEREAGISTLLGRVEELSRREEALTRSVDVLQSLAQQAAVNSPIKISSPSVVPPPITLVDPATASASARSRKLGSSRTNNTAGGVTPLSPLVGVGSMNTNIGSPLSSSSSPRRPRTLSPRQNNLTSTTTTTSSADDAANTTPPTPTPTILSLRVSNELREQTLAEREAAVQAREDAVSLAEKEVQTAKRAHADNVAHITQKASQDAATLAIAGKAELEALRAATLLETAQMKEALAVERTALTKGKEGLSEAQVKLKEEEKNIQHDRTMLARARDEIASRQSDIESASISLEMRQKEFAERSAERERELHSLSVDIAQQRGALMQDKANFQKDFTRKTEELQAAILQAEQESSRLLGEAHQHAEEIKATARNEADALLGQATHERTQATADRQAQEKEAEALRTALRSMLDDAEAKKNAAAEALKAAHAAEDAARAHADEAQAAMAKATAESIAVKQAEEEVKRTSSAVERDKSALAMDRAALQALALQIQDREKRAEHDVQRLEAALQAERDALNDRLAAEVAEAAVAAAEAASASNTNDTAAAVAAATRHAAEALSQAESSTLRAKEEAAHAQSQVEVLRAHVSRLEEELKATLASHAQEVAAAAAVEAADVAKLSSSSSAIEPVAGNIEQQQQQLAELRSLKTEMASEAEKRKQQEAILDRKANQIRTLFAELQARKEALETRVAQVTAEATQRTASLAEREASVQKLEQELLQQSAQNTASITPITTTTTTTIDGTKTSEDPAVLNNIITQLTEACRVLETRLRDAQMSHAESTSTVEHILVEKKDLEAKLQASLAQIALESSRAESTVKRKLVLEDSLRRAMNTISELEARIARLESVSQAISTSSQNNDADSTSANNINVQLARQVDELASAFSRKVQELGDSMARAEAAKLDCELKERKNEQLQGELSQVQQDLSSARQLLQHHRRAMGAATISRWMRHQRQVALNTSFRKWERACNMRRPNITLPQQPTLSTSFRELLQSSLQSRTPYHGTIPALTVPNLVVVAASPVAAGGGGTVREGTTTTNYGSGGFDFSAGAASFDFSAGSSMTGEILPTVTEESASPTNASSPVSPAKFPANNGQEQTQFVSLSNQTGSGADSMTSSVSISSLAVHHDNDVPEFILCSICNHQIPFDEVRQHSDSCFVRNKAPRPHTTTSASSSSSAGGAITSGIMNALRRVSHTATTPGTPSMFGSRSRTGTEDLDTSNSSAMKTSSFGIPRSGGTRSRSGSGGASVGNSISSSSASAAPNSSVETIAFPVMSLSEFEHSTGKADTK